MFFVVAPVANELTAIPSDLEAEGHTVITISEGDVDAERMTTPAPDVFLLLRAPWGPSDTDLAARISASGRALPIVAVSGPCEGRQRALAIHAGVDDFVVTPLRQGELATRVTALARTATSRYMRAEGFLVDFPRRRVFIDGRHVVLTPREYDLFVALAERVGEIVARTDLADRIDRSGTGRRSNVVDVHMSRIRAKLGSNAPLLQAVRGKGYRLRPAR
jgi:DNA-binding response OmpR family regulator